MKEEFLLVAVYLLKDDPKPYWIEQRGNVYGWISKCYATIDNQLSGSKDTQAFLIVLFKNWIILLENNMNVEQILPEYIS